MITKTIVNMYKACVTHSDSDWPMCLAKTIALITIFRLRTAEAVDKIVKHMRMADTTIVHTARG